MSTLEFIKLFQNELAYLNIKLNQNEVREVLGAFGSAIKKSDVAKIPGLGTFKFKERASRQVKNPRSGELMTVPARTVLTFKAKD